MAFLPAVLGAPLRAGVLERLVRGGPATIGHLAEDLEASRQNVSRVVEELAALGIVRGEAGKDRRAIVVRVNETHPFAEALRVLAVDAAAWYEAPETWQALIARRYGRDAYIGGYAAVRRVMQPVDFEAPSVLVNVLNSRGGSAPRGFGRPERPHATAAIERATGTKIRLREVDRIPPEVVPVERGDVEVWFATADRGFVEAWIVKEIPAYGLFLCLVQGLHDAVLDPKKLLAIGRAEGADGEMRTLLAAARERLPLRGLREPVRATRPLKAAERQALEQALNTVVG